MGRSPGLVEKPPTGIEPAADITAALGDIGLASFPPYLMNRIMGRYNASLRAELAALGLTTPKMRALAILSVMDGLLIRDVAIHAVVEQSTLSRVLDQLVAEGHVRRERDADDSRAVRVHLTESGRSAFERLWPHMVEAEARMFRGIAPAQKAAFVATLQTMLKNVRKHEI